METAEDRTINRIINSFGEPFVRYVLGIPDGMDLRAAITEVHQPALALLLSAMQQALTMGDGSVDMTFVAPNHFTTYRPDLEATLVQQLRRLSGGAIEDAPEHDNPVVASLYKIARDIWPALLIVPGETRFPKMLGMSSMASTINHPHMLSACKAIMADENLKMLFPGEYEISDTTSVDNTVIQISGEWMMSDGSGGTHQLVGLPSMIIFNAALLAQHEGRLELTYDSLCGVIPRVVEMYRSLAMGEKVEVPVIVGLSGVIVDPGTSYDFDTAGKLRGLRRIEKDLLLHNSNQVTSVLETTYPMRILKVSASGEVDSDTYFKEWRKFAPSAEESHRTLEKRIDRVRLAVLLASKSNEQLLATSVVSRFMVNLSQGGGSQWGAEVRPHASFPLSTEEAAEAVLIHRVVLEKHPDSLDIAQKRILSAVSQRWDAIDAAIDAVVVWENAFGTRLETTFRVTGAVAKLLEPENMELRLELQNELKGLYGQRSALVHGAKEPTPDKAWKMRERTVEIAIRILKELYLTRPDLLPLKSEDRSNKLLLEGHGS